MIDEIVPEPEGGAHEDPDAAAGLLQAAISAAISEVDGLDPEERRRERRAKYRRMGVLAFATQSL